MIRRSLQTTMGSSYRFIDIGANLTDPVFRGMYRGKQAHEDDYDAVLSRGWEAGLERVIVTAGMLSEAKEALELVGNDDRLFTTVGVHPTRCLEFENAQKNYGLLVDEYTSQLRSLIMDNPSKIVAVGEFGLDYDRLHFCPKDVQQKYFEHQLVTLAIPCQKPLFLHNRNTGDDFRNILHTYRHQIKGGVVHSFDGTMDEMKAYIEMGLYIGLNGCSLRTQESLDVAKEIPLDRLMLETDAPWCGIKASHPSSKYIQKHFDQVRKEKWRPNAVVKDRNEPSAIRNVFEVICGLHDIDLVDGGDDAAGKATEIANQIYANTMQVFWPDE